MRNEKEVKLELSYEELVIVYDTLVGSTTLYEKYGNTAVELKTYICSMFLRSTQEKIKNEDINE